MANFDLLDHYRNISSFLYSQYRLSSAYGHHGTKGHLREGILIETLRAMAPDDVRINKGEICDSNGKRSPEFDVVISHQSTAIKLFSSPSNCVVPVETVLGVIEVKSMLARDGIEKLNSDLEYLNTFERYYEPTDLLRLCSDLSGTKGDAAIFDKPIGPSKSIKGLGPIIGILFAYESPQIPTIRTWLDSIQPAPNLAFLFVLNHFAGFWDPEALTWKIAEMGQDTFAGFARAFIELASSNQREAYIRCNSARYIEYSATAQLGTTSTCPKT
jgi:hypothetical protein